MVKILRSAVVSVIGRDTANVISAPYHDWMAKRRTEKVLAGLPKTGLLVNFGCGPRTLDGWINLDIDRADGIDVVWNLESGMPFRDNSCSALFSEHMLEHISRESAVALLRECRRVLEPGGVLRISTPDAGLYLRAYVGNRDFFAHPSFKTRGEETVMDRINLMMRENGGHQWVYDAESLIAMAMSAGFERAEQLGFGRSSHPRMANLDSADREYESLYVEATKG